MHGLAILGLVIIIFILILNRHISGLTSSASQCANCPTKPSGTYYTSVEGCTTAACGTCPTVANGNNVLTPCTDATTTKPTGSAGSCTLTCNQGYSIGTDGKSCVPDCVGSWSACSTSCGPGEYTYQVSTPAGPGGKSCKDVDGTVRNQGDKKPCANPDCGQNCEGAWSAFGGCSSVCGYGTKTRKFTAIKEARNGGTACETTYGQNAHWPESYETTTCTGLPACTSGQACEGSWSDWGTCSATCDGGLQTKTYTVTKAATVGTDGTRGAACPYADGATQQQACNTQSCCSKAAVGAWEKYGSVRCSGNSSGKPEQLWARNIVFPSGTPVNTTAASCSIGQFATQFTAAGCPDVAPSAGTCSVTGATWSATGGCTLPAAANPSSGSCTNGGTWSLTGCSIPTASTTPTKGTCTNGGTWSAASGCTPPARQFPSDGVCTDPTVTWKKDAYNAVQPSGCSRRWYDYSLPGISPGIMSYGQDCPAGYIRDQPLGYVAGCYRTPMSTTKSLTCPAGWTPNLSEDLCYPPATQIDTLTCPTGYTGDKTTNKCVKNSTSILSIICPANYTADKTNNKCTANPVSISGLTCPAPYWSENRTINMCSATTVGDSAPAT